MADAAPTNELWRQLRDGQGEVPPLTAKTVHALAEQLRFFHWHLQFPQIVAKGGFDVVLGNPPWVRQEFLKLEKRLLTQFSSYASTADSSVYFIERGVQVGSSSGFVAMLTPNKWFRAAYAESLRAFVRRRCRVTFIVDFGHSRTLFPDADTFPALVALCPAAAPVSDSETATFVRAHDADLANQSLRERINTARVAVAHASLKAEHWHLEDTAVTGLLDRLLATGKTLEASLQRGLLSGLKTGFNDAFYVDGPTRDALVALDPSSAPLFKKMLRGRDIKRWSPEWAGLWHIVIASSQNRTWPWSLVANEDAAEAVFAETYPSVHQHLKKFEASLRSRQDRGTFWWELRSCDYYDILDAPKIVVQDMAFYSQFSLDLAGYCVNNTVVMIPTVDQYVLAILNSRIVWWMLNRICQQMKDGGLKAHAQYLQHLPIPDAPPELRADVSSLAQRVLAESVPSRRAVLELQLDELVMQAFAMTSVEQKMLVENLPPRDPLERAKAELESDAGSKLLPAMPTVVPQLAAAEETALFIWALVHAAGGIVTRTEIARAFALRARPALLTQLAPASLTQAGDWATKVSSRSVAQGILAATLRALSERDGVTLGINSESQSMVSASQNTPTEAQLDPWFRFEAQLTLQVLRALPTTAFRAIDDSLAGDDRSLIEQSRRAS